MFRQFRSLGGFARQGLGASLTCWCLRQVCPVLVHLRAMPQLYVDAALNNAKDSSVGLLIRAMPHRASLGRGIQSSA